jgi:uncharacterized iron-regulated membrane protein
MMTEMDGLPTAQLVERILEEEAHATLWCRVAWRERQRRRWAERYLMAAFVAGMVVGALTLAAGYLTGVLP